MTHQLGGLSHDLLLLTPRTSGGSGPSGLQLPPPADEAV